MLTVFDSSTGSQTSRMENKTCKKSRSAGSKLSNLPRLVCLYRSFDFRICLSLMRLPQSVQRLFDNQLIAQCRGQIGNIVRL